MEFVEGLITFAVYGVVIAGVAMITPRIGNALVALKGVLTGRRGRMTPAE